jgi:hypothetical protein
MDIIYFIPTQDFFSTETRSQYVKGQRYTVRKGNDKLALLVKQWLDAGKVFVPAVKPGQSQPAFVHGKGTVSDTPPKRGIFERIKSWL